MIVRIVFRTVHGFEQTHCKLDDPLCGALDQHEWFFYVFEVSNVLLFVTALLIWPPGKYLPPSSKIFLHPVDGTERIGPGFSKADKRSLWRSVLDPFNLHGIMTGQGLIVDKFWENEWPLYVAGGPVNTEQDRVEGSVELAAKNRADVSEREHGK